MAGVAVWRGFVYRHTSLAKMQPKWNSWDPAVGLLPRVPWGVLGGWAFSRGRGTPVWQGIILVPASWLLVSRCEGVCGWRCIFGGGRGCSLARADANTHPGAPQRETESTEYGVRACGGSDRDRGLRQCCGSGQAVWDIELIGPARVAEFVRGAEQPRTREQHGTHAGAERTYVGVAEPDLLGCF